VGKRKEEKIIGQIDQRLEIFLGNPAANFGMVRTDGSLAFLTAGSESYKRQGPRFLRRFLG
jgi:hypothetical protein